MSERIGPGFRALVAAASSLILLYSGCAGNQQDVSQPPASSLEFVPDVTAEPGFEVPPGTFELPETETPLPPDALIPLENPTTTEEPTCDVPALDSREKLVSFLDENNAFNVSYTGNPEDAKNDLLSPDKSTEKLWQFLARLTTFGFCNNAEFDVLIVNTGHSRYTQGPDGRPSGRESQHIHGQAVDIRPRSFPDGSEIPVKATVTDLILVRDLAARERAQKLGFYLLSAERTNLRQLISSGFNPNYNRGNLIDYTAWPLVVINNHWEHIHAGLQP